MNKILGNKSYITRPRSVKQIQKNGNAQLIIHLKFLF